jgi:hypothetical protein
MVGELEPEQIGRLRVEAQTHLPGLQAPALASFGAFEAAVRQRRGA